MRLPRVTAALVAGVVLSAWSGARAEDGNGSMGVSSRPRGSVEGAAGAMGAGAPSAPASGGTALSPLISALAGGGVRDSRSPGGAGGAETAQPVRIVLLLTLLALLPALLVSVTPFLRNIIVLSMLRHGLGLNETPPNQVLIGLALFLTMFTMTPSMERIDREAFRPFMEGRLSVEAGAEKAMVPIREFMVRQTREEDLALMVELSKAPTPRSIDEVSNVQLVPAYMLSELRSAFQIGFVVLLPFLLIDLIVSTVLMALGMMMMPPITVSLPIKVLMFVLVDGWALLVKSLVGSFA